MPQLLRSLKRHFLTKEFILFLIVGCINTFNGSALSWLISQLVNSNLAFNIGYLLSNIIAYWMNSEFIFHAPLSLERYMKFAVSYLPNYIIQNIIVVVFYNLLGFPNIASFLIAAVLGVPVTFLFVKIFAFGKK